MSIHVELSDEAKNRIRAQKRNSTISSVLISAMVVSLVFLSLGFFLLPDIVEESATLVTYSAPPDNELKVQEKKVTKKTQKKPSAPSSNISKVIASTSASPTSIPVPEVEVFTPSADFGDGEEFGGGWGDTGDMGNGGGFAAIPATMRKRCSKEDRILRLREMGGNPLAEEVVERGLEWIKATQKADGSWANDRQAAMTGFSILAYLGRCETPLSEKYGVSCLNGITWLVDLGLKTDGKMSTNLGDNHWVYEHSIATYALCEAVTFCKQLGIAIPNLQEVAKMAVEVIIENQHERTGGWDYAYDTTSGRGGDLSIAAWQIQALKAAYHTGMDINGLEISARKGTRYVETLQNENGGFGYKDSKKPIRSSPNGYFSLTGAGMLSLQMWGKGSSSAVRKGSDYILDNSVFSYDTEESDFYGHYYEAQAMMIRGGAEWKRYNAMFKDQLVLNQNQNGSWKKPGFVKHGLDNEHYRNCLAILMLETYYRFLPGTAAK